MKTPLRQPLLAALLCLAPMAPVALSQQPDVTERERATTLAREAAALFNLFEYQEALDKYKAAYALSKEPELLFYIGQCYEQLQESERAIISYQLFLELSPTGPLAQSANTILKERAARQPAPDSAAAPSPSNNEVSTPTARLLYGGAVTGLSLSMLTGALAISTRLRASELAITNSAPDEFAALSLRARRLGVATDLMMIGSIASGVAAHISSPYEHTSWLLFGAGGAFTIAGATSGALALSADLRAASLSDPDDARLQQERAVIFSRTADLSFLSAAIFGGVGLWMSLHQERAVSLSPASRGVALQITF